MENLHTFRTHDREAQPIDLPLIALTLEALKSWEISCTCMCTLDPERKASRIPENLALDVSRLLTISGRQRVRP
jgi:hypothetical protein